MDEGKRIISLLEEEYPEVRGTSLNYRSPLEILVATILSAQSTDLQINKITAELFKKYRTAADYANVSREELEEDIRSSGFFRRKAAFIQEVTRVVAEEHGGEVPASMEELTALKGVARKTANIVLGAPSASWRASPWTPTSGASPTAWGSATRRTGTR